eukprot:scaffold19932_cov21-Tisochrysis_lutea.AAC.4
MVTLGTLRTKVCREGSRGQFRAILYSRIRGCKGRAVLMHAWMQRGRLQEDLRGHICADLRSYVRGGKLGDRFYILELIGTNAAVIE